MGNIGTDKGSVCEYSASIQLFSRVTNYKIWGILVASCHIIISQTSQTRNAYK